jgi:hypothetical protein
VVVVAVLETMLVQAMDRAEELPQWEFIQQYYSHLPAAVVGMDTLEVEEVVRHHLLVDGVVLRVLL